MEINFPENFDPLSLRIMMGVQEIPFCPVVGWVALAPAPARRQVHVDECKMWSVGDLSMHTRRLKWELERKTKLPVKQKLKE